MFQKSGKHDIVELDGTVHIALKKKGNASWL